MSWDKTEYAESAVCACGRGRIVRHVCIKEDDWNRVQQDIIEEKICCDECAKNYHIEHYVCHCFQPSWKGDGIIDRTYLVPNHYAIPDEIREQYFEFNLDEQIVATYCLEEILNAKQDMIQSRYSTRLERQSSREIVKLYAKKHKRRGLGSIVDLLTCIENQYEKYEWTSQRLSEFRNQEKLKIQENRKRIAAILEQSFELDFKRNQR